MRRIFTVIAITMLLSVAVSAAAATPEYLRKELDAIASVPGGTWFAMSKSNFKLFVMDGKNVVDSFDIAVGKNKGQKQKVGDNKTPEGMFRIIQIQKAGHWTHDFRDGKGEIKGAYGPWFIRLETGWKGIGIHGTHNPASIGTNATEGCIRLRNDELLRLKDKYVKIGVKVFIFN